MKKLNKTMLLAVGIGFLLITGSVWALRQNNKADQEQSVASEPVINTDTNSDTQPAVVNDSAQAPDTPVSSTATGRYTSYSPQKVGESGYEQTVLFFHASWCPECRAFKQNISSDVPEGVQILEVNYDTSQDLKQKYGVTLQSTFVRVSGDGTLQTKWVGYGKDKSLQTVLSNLD